MRFSFKKFFLCIITLIILFLFFSQNIFIVNAQDPNISPTNTGTPPNNTGSGNPINNATGGGTPSDSLFINPLGADSIYEVVYVLMDVIVKIGYVLVIIFIIYAGYLFVVSQGNKDKITKARKNLFYVLIGSLLLLAAQGLSLTLCNLAADFDPLIGDQCRPWFLGNSNNNGTSGGSINQSFQPIAFRQLTQPRQQEIENILDEVAENPVIEQLRNCNNIARRSFVLQVIPYIKPSSSQQTPPDSSSNTGNTANTSTPDPVAVSNTTSNPIDNHTNNATPKTFVPADLRDSIDQSGDGNYGGGTGGNNQNPNSGSFIDQARKTQIGTYLGDHDVVIQTDGQDPNKPATLNLSDLWNDPNYQNNPYPIQVNGYVNGVTITPKNNNVQAHSSSPDYQGTFGSLDDSYDPNNSIFVRTANGYDMATLIDDNGNPVDYDGDGSLDSLVQLEDKTFCFCSANHNNVNPPLSTITGGMLPDELIYQKPNESLVYNFGGSTFIPPNSNNVTNVPTQNVSSPNSDTYDIIIDPADGTFFGLEQNNNQKQELLFLQGGTFDEQSPIDTDKLNKYIAGARFIEDQTGYGHADSDNPLVKKVLYVDYGTQNDTAKVNTLLTDSERGGVDRAFARLGEKTIGVSNLFLENSNDEVLKSSGQHEALHLFNDNYGIPNALRNKYSAENRRGQTGADNQMAILQPNLLRREFIGMQPANESQIYGTGTGGHLTDNYDEYATSIANSVYAPDWNNKVNELEQQNPGFKTEYKQALNDYKDVLEQKGLTDTGLYGKVGDRIEQL